MRVLLVVGNEGRFWLEQWCGRLGQAGVEVRVFRIPTRVARYAAIPALCKLASEFKPDVVWTWFATTAGYTTALSRVRPVVLTVLGSDVLGLDKGLFRRVRATVALRAAAHITTTTPLTSDFQSCLRRLGVPSEKVVSSAWGIDDLFCPVDRVGARQKMTGRIPDLAEDDFVILSLRDAKPYYRQVQLVRALAACRGASPRRPRLVIFVGNGEPSYLESLYREGDALGVSDLMCLIDRHLTSTELRDLYAAADLGVSIPKTDRLGGPIIEFIKTGGGKLVLSDLPSYHELLGEQPGIRYVDGDEVEELVSSFLSLEDDPHSLPSAVAHRLEGIYDWGRSVEDLIRVFEAASRKASGLGGD